MKFLKIMANRKQETRANDKLEIFIAFILLYVADFVLKTLDSYILLHIEPFKAQLLKLAMISCLQTVLLLI